MDITNELSKALFMNILNKELEDKNLDYYNKKDLISFNTVNYIFN